MNALRSMLYLLLVAAYTPIYVILLLCFFWLPAGQRRALAMPWVDIALWLIRHVLGIDHRVIGLDHLPATPCVVLAKHQSAWETIALQRIIPNGVYVYKRELHWLPFFGWALKMMPFVAIDRAAGRQALEQVARRGKQRLDEGWTVIVFPEGTRVAPGTKGEYKIGGAFLAAKAGVPVVPVALDAGECWRRNAFVKRPGLITVSIGPLIETRGLRADAINQRAAEWIEAEMRRLSPHRYPEAASAVACEMPDIQRCSPSTRRTS